MGLLDGFPFKSFAQVKKEREEYDHKIFHLGEGHKEKIKEVLQLNITDKKRQQDALYIFVCMKAAYLENEQDQHFYAMKSVKTIPMDFTEQEKELIFKLVCKDIQTQELSHYNIDVLE